MTMRATAFLLAAVLALVQPALAQQRGPNGGLVAGKGEHVTELIVSPSELTVYILEHGKSHSTEGVTLRAVIQAGGKTANVNFTPADDQKLVTKLSAPLEKGAIVVLTGKDHHGDAISARYVLP
jgi:maltose-binding protein MalE